MRTQKCKKEYYKIKKGADYTIDWYVPSKKRLQPFPLLANANCIGNPGIPKLGLKAPEKMTKYWKSNP